MNVLALKRTENTHALALSGGIENLLDTDIVMLAGTACSTFEAGGGLEWPGAEKPAKMAKVGSINSVFMLMEPAAKISEQDAAKAYEALPAGRASEIERMLWAGTRQVKGRMPHYCIVSSMAAIVMRMSRRENLEYMLVPTFETQLDEQKTHVGFIPARLLFEKLEAQGGVNV